MSLKLELLKYERRAVRNALSQTKGDVAAAARLLQVPVRTLWSRLQRPLCINPTEYRQSVNTAFTERAEGQNYDTTWEEKDKEAP